MNQTILFSPSLNATLYAQKIFVDSIFAEWMTTHLTLRITNLHAQVLIVTLKLIGGEK